MFICNMNSDNVYSQIKTYIIIIIIPKINNTMKNNNTTNIYIFKPFRGIYESQLIVKIIKIDK